MSIIPQANSSFLENLSITSTINNLYDQSIDYFSNYPYRETAVNATDRSLQIADAAAAFISSIEYKSHFYTFIAGVQTIFDYFEPRVQAIATHILTSQTFQSCKENENMQPLITLLTPLAPYLPHIAGSFSALLATSGLINLSKSNRPKLQSIACICSGLALLHFSFTKTPANEIDFFKMATLATSTIKAMCSAICPNQKRSDPPYIHLIGIPSSTLNPVIKISLSNASPRFD